MHASARWRVLGVRVATTDRELGHVANLACLQVDALVDIDTDQAVARKEGEPYARVRATGASQHRQGAIKRDKALAVLVITLRTVTLRWS